MVFMKPMLKMLQEKFADVSRRSAERMAAMEFDRFLNTMRTPKTGMCVSACANHGKYTGWRKWQWQGF